MRSREGEGSCPCDCGHVDFLGLVVAGESRSRKRSRFIDLVLRVVSFLSNGSISEISLKSCFESSTAVSGKLRDGDCGQNSDDNHDDQSQ